MREIKFRAWNKDISRMFSADEMGEDELTINPNGSGFVNVNGTSTKLSQYYPHMVPLQCIGYVDINKMDIYEGDILKDLFNRILLVEWRNGGFCFKALTDTNFKYAHTISQWFEFDMQPPRVIGNMYENPELVHSSKPPSPQCAKHEKLNEVPCQLHTKKF